MNLWSHTSWIEEGDSNPAVSPSGDRLAFVRTTYRENGELRNRVMVAGRDGSNPRSVYLAKGWKPTELEWQGDRLSFMSSRVVQKRSRERQDVKVIAVDPDGGKPRVLYSRTLRPTRYNPYYGFPDPYMLNEVDLSPDGTHVVFERQVKRRESVGSIIQLTRIANGRTRMIAGNGREPSWSPDGSRIVYADRSAREGKACARRSCRASLLTVKADGSDRRRIHVERGDPGNPQWSPDGSTIVFESNRNYPSLRPESNEVYSVGADGSCLTWLTNGSPGSHQPSWGPEAGRATEPLECGHEDREPLSELLPEVGSRAPGGPHYWPGQNLEGMLLSDAGSGGNWQIYDYADCGYYSPAMCLMPFAVESDSPCSSVAGNVWPGDHRGLTMLRGAIVDRTQRTRSETTVVYTGRRNVRIGRSDFLDPVFGSRLPDSGFHLRVIENLRPVGQMAPSSDPLEMALLPGYYFRWQVKLNRAIERTGSLRGAAKVLKTRVRWLKNDLRFYRNLEDVGPYGKFECPRDR